MTYARRNGYAAVLAQGGTKAGPEYNVWMGCLPWTTYVRMGFECIAREHQGEELPWWAAGEASPEVMTQVNDALQAGCTPGEFCTRLMLLRL